MTDTGMSALDSEIRDLLRFAAQRSMLPRFQNLASGEIEQKGEDDPVTVVDREVEQFLTDALTKLAPDVPVVGEDAAHEDKSVLEHLSSACWIIDPLDGTFNFSRGQHPFGIIVALADAGEAVAGWIYDPKADRLCHTRRGEGAFINGERVTAQPTGGDRPVAAISMIFLDAEQKVQVNERLAPYYTCVETPRCAAEQYPRLALGQNDVSFFERTLAWDHAAGVLWLNEAGGKVARPDGSPYRVDEWDRKGMLGAASPALWDELAARMDGMY